MGVTKEQRFKIGLLKSNAANEREITKQQGSPYKRYVKKLRLSKELVPTPYYEPSACTRG